MHGDHTADQEAAVHLASSSPLPPMDSTNPDSMVHGHSQLEQPAQVPVHAEGRSVKPGSEGIPPTEVWSEHQDTEVLPEPVFPAMPVTCAASVGGESSHLQTVPTAGQSSNAAVLCESLPPTEVMPECPDIEVMPEPVLPAVPVCHGAVADDKNSHSQTEPGSGQSRIHAVVSKQVAEPSADAVASRAEGLSETLPPTEVMSEYPESEVMPKPDNPALFVHAAQTPESAQPPVSAVPSESTEGPQSIQAHESTQLFESAHQTAFRQQPVEGLHNLPAHLPAHLSPQDNFSPKDAPVLSAELEQPDDESAVTEEVLAEGLTSYHGQIAAREFEKAEPGGAVLSDDDPRQALTEAIFCSQPLLEQLDAGMLVRHADAGDTTCQCAEAAAASRPQQMSSQPCVRDHARSEEASPDSAEVAAQTIQRAAPSDAGLQGVTIKASQPERWSHGPHQPSTSSPALSNPPAPSTAQLAATRLVHAAAGEPLLPGNDLPTPASQHQHTGGEPSADGHPKSGALPLSSPKIMWSAPQASEDTASDAQPPRQAQQHEHRISLGLKLILPELSQAPGDASPSDPAQHKGPTSLWEMTGGCNIVPDSEDPDSMQAIPTVSDGDHVDNGDAAQALSTEPASEQIDDLQAGVPSAVEQGAQSADQSGDKAQEPDSHATAAVQGDSAAQDSPASEQAQIPEADAQHRLIDGSAGMLNPQHGTEQAATAAVDQTADEHCVRAHNSDSLEADAQHGLIADPDHMLRMSPEPGIEPAATAAVGQTAAEPGARAHTDDAPQVRSSTEGSAVAEEPDIEQKQPEQSAAVHEAACEAASRSAGEEEDSQIRSIAEEEESGAPSVAKGSMSSEDAEQVRQPAHMAKHPDTLDKPQRSLLAEDAAEHEGDQQLVLTSADTMTEAPARDQSAGEYGDACRAPCACPYPGNPILPVGFGVSDVLAYAG